MRPNTETRLPFNRRRISRLSGQGQGQGHGAENRVCMFRVRGLSLFD